MLKTKYNTDKTELENKIPDTSGLVKKTNYNTKITELENKIPDISNLAAKTALTAIENKIPSVSDNHNHDKYIDTSEFNKLASDVFNARLAQANLIKKKQILMLNYQVLTEKLLKINQNIYLLKMN